MWNEKNAMIERYIDPDWILEDEIETLREALDVGNQIEVCLTSLYEDEDGYNLVGKFGKTGIDVIIRDTDWFPDLPARPIQMSELDPSKVTPKEWVRQQAMRSIGGHFSVLLLEEDEESIDPCFYASRLLAMEEDRQETFFSGETPQPNDLIMIRVVNATPRRVKVEAAGVECVIRRDEMSWIFKKDCQEAFPPGTILEAIIMRCNVYPDETGKDGRVDLELSVKRVKPFYDGAWKYDIGDLVLGTVISEIEKGMVVDLAGETTCFVSLHKRFTRPKLGQKIIVEITMVTEDEEKGRRLSGVIKSRLATCEIRKKEEGEETFRQKAEESYLEWLSLNRCVPIDLAYEYLINYYRVHARGETDEKKQKYFYNASDRIMASLRVRGLMDDGDGCHHAPRYHGSLLEDPKPDRLLRLSETFQIHMSGAKGETRFVVPTKVSALEVMTLQGPDGEVKSVAVVPDGDAQVIQSWIWDLEGKVFDGLYASSPEEDLNFWKKHQAHEAARGMGQVILAEDETLIEKIRALPDGEKLLENSEICILPLKSQTRRMQSAS